ncbi:UDP-4-amino-4,6-dideoxy-N-acetyl-beta-L-altrosamine transaminase [Paenibacillus hexagrammi]|uniref:UDP-4-amino-4, 6-dideoxy-N-acetyl-beta-L-altrosamine transaminase n=1 Tax=Paenibacillus hexagrammi TaxID=2908839 RepID=A0ABY3SJ79_9BACL|nr:UDP-4-amino-4,6-dideoxy-N-acetyl-beta-L-altrosamine transaminase [Paenibacillus sp. YPD9-1]UJF33196.1 UDP-4-amino-4,6-dideoxy-N-acetyl-beta-L-altrosamine transaminase [Paenibacillus sp. YPD9-1]
MLAIEGGRPVRDEFLPYGMQWIDEEDIALVVETLRGPLITQGPLIAKFEQAVAEFVGAKYAVAFCNGTAALHGACFAAGIGPGDEVITTPITFAASANCVLYMGGKPIFADINPETYNIDPGQIHTHITPRTKAIIPVDFTGQPVDMDEIYGLAKAHGLTIIQDAAHSLGALYKGRNVGTLADMTMFSFHPVKHITTGEGGIIVTDSEKYADKLRLFRSHGITRENMLKDEGPWYYEMQELGYNYRITDLQAALGISQLEKLPMFLEKRRSIAEAYDAGFKDMEEVDTPYQLPNTQSSWHLYMLRFNIELLTATRRQLFEALRAENIGVHVHYIPVYLHPYYQQLGYTTGLCPRAEKWYGEVLTLPIFPRMSAKDFQDVIDAVKKVIRRYRK